MLKHLWYWLFKTYMGIGLFFFFKKISTHHKENIPKKGAVLFVSNHKNALIDPLLIATTNKRNIHFLTRASAFKIKLVHWFLSTLNMMPIYRIRDGRNTLSKNEAIFKKCYDILNAQKCLLIFPEGVHDIKRWVRPLSKGFTRIVFGTLEQNPDLELHIVPIGLNYSNATNFGESVSIYYGKSILANEFYTKEDINTSAKNLKNKVHEKLKELTAHIGIENYDNTIEQLGNIDYLNPAKVNEVIKGLPNSKPEITNLKRPSLCWKLLKTIVAINSFIPLLIFKSFLPKIKQIEFISTTKFAIGITAFPLFYGFQSLVINHFFGMQASLIYLLVSIALVLVLDKSK